MRHVCSLEGLTATYEVESAAPAARANRSSSAIFTVLGTVVFRLIWMATVFRLVPTFEMLMDVYVASWVFTGGALLIVICGICERFRTHNFRARKPRYTPPGFHAFASQIILFHVRAARQRQHRENGLY